MSNKEHKKHPYLLKDLKISHKNQVTDITYIPMAKGFMYLTAIIDLHTRFVLNWRKQHNECRLVCRYFARNYTKVWCAFNTDQGSQYTSEVHTNVLLNNGIKISMDGKGRAIDNFY
jgi:putative transposase